MNHILLYWMKCHCLMRMNWNRLEAWCGVAKPDPNNVPSDVIKMVSCSCSQIVLNMYNSFLRKGVFPKRERAEAGIVNKDTCCQEWHSHQHVNTGYIQKVPRKIALVRTESVGDLFNRHYGFWKDWSTVGTLEEVVKTFHVSQQDTQRGIILQAILDIRNTFNSPRWSDKLCALVHFFRIPQYLLWMVQSYLSDGELIYNSAYGSHRKKITVRSVNSSTLDLDLV